MVSEGTKMNMMRGSVVVSAAAAALYLGATAMLPIFQLNVDKLNSSITQFLWTTDIYTPLGEKHMSVKSFLKNCDNLVTAFQVAQVSTLLGIAALTLAFLCAVFHMTPTFTQSRYRVRTVCGAPICTLLTVALIATGVNCYLMHAMYENKWCENSAYEPMVATHFSSPPTSALTQPSRRYLHKVWQYWRFFSIPRLSTKPRLSPQPKTTLGKSDDAVMLILTHRLFGDCNPFDGCIVSFREMGFKVVAGWQATWAALAVAITAFFAELMVVIVGGRRLVEAGVGESAVALLQGEDERLL
ncbi:hypothetical protein LPMP_080650 [Leishmania panamensis]|uniref:Amastin-like protein, putative n=1 Tax=Leishmania panamensis TaxID=5679 RepID=A0A088RL13_LEIPA|nr:hypothetical protein LPMP_080650 [Leishmania panamensis]AIN95874.1 hypothetical protein LPMP_080650 [Leishmania panamensis]